MGLDLNYYINQLLKRKDSREGEIKKDRNYTRDYYSCGISENIVE